MPRFLGHIERFLDSSGLLNLIVLLLLAIMFFSIFKGAGIGLLFLIIVPFQYKLWKSFMEGSKKAYTAQIVIIYVALVTILYDAIQLAIYGFYANIVYLSWVSLPLTFLGVAPGGILWLIHFAMIYIDPYLALKYIVYQYFAYVVIVAVYAVLISYYVWCKLREKCERPD